MAVRADDARIDAFERRAIWLTALATIVLVFGTFSLAFSSQGEAWKVALFVAAQAALVACVGLAALTLVPGRASAAKIEAVLFWAFVLFWLALLLTAVNVSVSAIEYIGEPGFE